MRRLVRSSPEQRWPGPLPKVIYLQHRSQENCLLQITGRWLFSCRPGLCLRKRLHACGFHPCESLCLIFPKY